MNMNQTEYDKMLSGELYHSSDPKMIALCKKARELTIAYNSNSQNKEVILKELLGNIGENVAIDIPFYIDHGIHTTIGNNVIIGMNCIFVDNHKITIGNNVMIASGVQLCTATHPIKKEERIVKNWSPEIQRNWYHTYAKPIEIGNDCWIGANATILPGVSIGNNVVIGAGSVVTKNIPDNSLAIGVPSKVIKKI